MRLSTVLGLLFLCLFFTIQAQEFQDVWLQSWVKNEGVSNTLAGRNLTVTAADFVYDAVHQLNEHGQHDLVLSKTTLKGDVLWIDTFNLSATTANMLLGDMTIDGNGNIIVTGAVYNGTNNYDVITVKYTGAGVLLWHQLYDGSASSYDGGLRVITDNSNNIYVTGGATSTANAMDLLILAYNSYGTLNWSELYDGHGNFDAGSHLAISGSLTVIGVSQTTDPTLWRIASRKYQLSNGALIAGAESSDVALSEVRDVVLDSNDDIYVTGWKFTPGQGKDAVIVKWSDGASSVDWEAVYNGYGSGDDFTNSIAVASNGDVVVGGYTATVAGDRDGLLLKYSSTGQLLWQQTCSGASGEDDEITDVLLDETAGEVYLAGQVREYADADYLFERRKLGNGSLQHQEIFAGWVGGDDKAEVLLKDADSGVILSGKTAAGNGSERPTTVRYKKETYFLPPNTEEPHASLPYIHNYEQLAQTDGTVAEKVFYYVQSSPAKYLRRKKMHLVLSSIDTISTTPDTLCRVDVDFSGDKGQRIYAMDERSSYHNYYLEHIDAGRTKVALTDEILHRDAWLGIDILHGSNNAGVTYDFIVQPGVDPNLIEMTFTGHTSLAINGAGELEIGTALGTITWPAPQTSIYDAQGVDYPVLTTTAYTVVGTDKVKLNGLGINATRYQVVSVRWPELVGGPRAGNDWITYFGGEDNFDEEENEIITADALTTVDVGRDGEIYVAGKTFGTDLPVNEGTSEIYGSAKELSNAIFAEFNPNFSLSYRTIIAGSGEIWDMGVNNGKVFVCGNVDETTIPFPATTGPVMAQGSDAFVGRFDQETGTREVLYLLTAPGDDWLASLDFSSDGQSIYMAGTTSDGLGTGNYWPNVPQTGAYNQGQNHSTGFTTAYIFEFNRDLDIEWSTPFGSRRYDLGYEIAVKPGGGFYLLGQTGALGYSGTVNAPPSSWNDNFPSGFQSSSDDQLANQVESANFFSYDLFLAEFGSANDLLWTTFIGTEKPDLLKVESNGKLVINPNDPNEVSLMGTSFDFQGLHVPSGQFGYTQNDDQPTIGRQFICTFRNRQLYWSSGFGCLLSGFGFNRPSISLSYDESANLFIAGVTDCEGFESPNCEDESTTTEFALCRPALQSQFFEEDHDINTSAEGSGSNLDAFISVLSPQRELLYSSFFGGSNLDEIRHLLFADGRLNFVGLTRSGADPTLPTDFPFGSYTQDFMSGEQDGFIGSITFDFLTDTEDVVVQSAPNWSVYPNPAGDQIFLRVTEDWNWTAVEYKIYTVLGQELLQGELNFNAASDQAEIDISILPSGSYLLNAQDQYLKFVKFN